jgi:hypothetical protein
VDYVHQWFVEPRVGLEYWLSPWMTIGAMGGFDPLNGMQPTVGIYWQGHNRSFDDFYRAPSRN